MTDSNALLRKVLSMLFMLSTAAAAQTPPPQPVAVPPQYRDLWVTPLKGEASSGSGQVRIEITGQVAQGIFQLLERPIKTGEAACGQDAEKSTEDISCARNGKEYICIVTFNLQTGTVVKSDQDLPYPACEEPEDAEFLKQNKKNAKKHGYWKPLDKE